MHRLTYPRNRAGERRCRGSGRGATWGCVWRSFWQISGKSSLKAMLRLRAEWLRRADPDPELLWARSGHAARRSRQV